VSRERAIRAQKVGDDFFDTTVCPCRPGQKQKSIIKGIETIAYLLEGKCSVYYGDELEYRVMVHAGDQVYVPEDVPHAPYNQGAAPCKWLVVHSSGSDQDGIVLLPGWTFYSPKNRNRAGQLVTPPSLPRYSKRCRLSC
jgi:uncharacterized RmlC-like cupin family protein